jgi:hypothetical protein
MSCHRHTLQNSRCGSVDKAADYGGEDLLQHENHTSATEPLMCLMPTKTPLHCVKGAHFWRYGGQNIFRLYGKLRLRMFSSSDLVISCLGTGINYLIRVYQTLGSI